MTSHKSQTICNWNERFLYLRAAADLKSHMVVANSMEEFQKELDSGKVNNLQLHWGYESFPMHS